MYQTYPSVKHCKQYGSASMPSGGGTSYPGQSLPSTANDARDNRVKQSGNGAGKPKASRPKGQCGCNMFPALNGLPR